MVLSLVAAPGTSIAWADSEDAYGTACEHDGEIIEEIVPARPDEDGYNRTICADCGEILDEEDIIAPYFMELSKSSYTYNNKTHKPSVEVYDFDEEEIEQISYSVVEFCGKKLTLIIIQFLTLAIVRMRVLIRLPLPFMALIMKGTWQKVSILRRQSRL